MWAIDITYGEIGVLTIYVETIKEACDLSVILQKSPEAKVVSIVNREDLHIINSEEEAE